MKNSPRANKSDDSVVDVVRKFTAKEESGWNLNPSTTTAESTGQEGML